MADKKIICSMIIEMLGRPPEHLNETMEKLIESLSKEKGVIIINSKIYEPKKFEELSKDKESDKNSKKQIKVEQELFTTFAEIEAEFETIESLLVVAFNYMPSSIEVISPEAMIVRNSELNSLLTGIVLRLHKYDEIAKKLVEDNSMLYQRVQQFQQMFKVSEVKPEEKTNNQSDGKIGKKTKKKIDKEIDKNKVD